MLTAKLYLKRLRVESYDVAAFIIIACSVIFRLILTASIWPLTDSDEGTMGLEAMRIAFHGQHPIFFYGQDYMGVIEAYLGAIFFRILGVSVFSLRLGTILLFTLFLIAIYALTSLLYRKKLALLTVLLLSFGNIHWLENDLPAVGGITETLLFGTLSLLLASWLAFTGNVEQRRQQGWRRPATYACWGIVAGLGLWSDLLVAPFILVGGIILLVYCHREWRTWALACILLGFLVGGFPLIVYNLKAPLRQNSVAVAMSIQDGTNVGAGVAVGPVSGKHHLVGTFLYAVPIATGLYPSCSLDVLPYYGPTSPKTWACSIIQGGWSLGYMVLLFISAAMALVPLGKLFNAYRRSPETWSERQRQLSVLHFVRLMLILCGLVTVFLFFRSTIGAAKPTSTRYLIGLMIVLPAAIWPLWNGIEQLTPRTDLNRLWTALRYAVLVVAVVMVVGSTAAVLPLLPSANASALHDQQLAHDLEQRGITRFYTEYWTCDRLSFLTRGKLICSDLSLDLSTSLVNRMSAYYLPLVTRDKSAPIVVPVGAYSEAFDHNPKIVDHYHRFVLDGYVVYAPDP